MPRTAAEVAMLLANHTCENALCLVAFVKNHRGATAHHCSRCSQYARRHGGELPGAKRPPEGLTVSIPIQFKREQADFLRTMAGNSGESVASIVREAVERMMRDV